MRLKTKEKELLNRFKDLTDLFPGNCWKEESDRKTTYHLIFELMNERWIEKEIRAIEFIDGTIEFNLCNYQRFSGRWEGYDYPEEEDRYDGYEYYLRDVEKAVDMFEIINEQLEIIEKRSEECTEI